MTFRAWLLNLLDRRFSIHPTREFVNYRWMQ